MKHSFSYRSIVFGVFLNLFVLALPGYAATKCSECKSSCGAISGGPVNPGLCMAACKANCTS